MEELTGIIITNQVIRISRIHPNTNSPDLSTNQRPGLNMSMMEGSAIAATTSAREGRPAKDAWLFYQDVDKVHTSVGFFAILSLQNF